VPDHGKLRPRETELFFLRGSGAVTSQTLLGHFAGAETPGEFLDAASRVDKLLLAGEEGVTSRTDTEAEILLGGAGMVDRTAGADDLTFHVLGVDIGFHGSAKRSSIQAESKLHFKPCRPSNAHPDLMTALGGVEQVGDLTEDTDDSGVEQPKNSDRNYADNSQDQGILHQRLAFF